MRTYYVQLRSREQSIRITADTNPEIGQQGKFAMWDFKLNNEIVGRFYCGDVVAWWYYPSDEE